MGELLDREQEDWFRWAVESVTDYSFIFLDPGGRVSGWNSGAQRIKGYAAAEIIGAHFSRFYPYEAIEEGLPERALRMAASAGRFEDEGWRLRKDGSLFWAHVVITALRDERGGLRGFGKVTRDLTETKRTIDEIHRANTELELFASAIAHDLRIPLRVINGRARLLEKACGAKLDAGAAEHLRAIDGMSERLAAMISDLLGFCRVVHQPLRLEEIDMRELVSDAWFEIESRLPGTLIVHELPRVVGDRSLLRHVWTNLLSNAVKYTSRVEQPNIAVTGRMTRGSVTYGVHDNGIGLDMAQSQRLFNIFQRFHSYDEYEGTGVGLAIVQRIVNRHRGDIRARSEPGLGASFEFSLPHAG